MKEKLRRTVCNMSLYWLENDCFPKISWAFMSISLSYYISYQIKKEIECIFCLGFVDEVNNAYLGKQLKFEFL